MDSGLFCCAFYLLRGGMSPIKLPPQYLAVDFSNKHSYNKSTNKNRCSQHMFASAKEWLWMMTGSYFIQTAIVSTHR